MGKFYGLLLSLFCTAALLTALFVPNRVNGQTNLALSAVASHSGGGVTTFSAANYNDGVIAAGPSCTQSAQPWGWVTTSGWIKLTWSSPVTFNKIVLYKSNRPMTTCQMQYWNGSAFVTFKSYSSGTCTEDSVTFPPVTTTILQFLTVAGSSNPNHREIQVFSTGPAAPTVTGNSAVCAGSTLSLTASSPAPGPTYNWTGPGSFTATTATINIPSITASSAGVYSVTVTSAGATSQPTLTTVSVNPAPVAMTGVSCVILGQTAAFSDGTSGGTWSSSNGLVASVSGSGVVTGAGAGSANISYMLSDGCAVSMQVSVNALPPITGSNSVCSGATTTLADITSGGTWTSSNSVSAPIGSTTGVVTGNSTGATTITYTLPAGCYVTSPLTVNPAPSSISGPTTVCPGSTIALSDASSGGIWSSSNMAYANVGSASGVVSGISGGTPIISYVLPTGCFATQQVTVNTTAPIIGTLGLCVGFGTTLSEAISGGTWSSSNSSVASIGSASGVVTTSSPGIATISYLFPNGCISTATLNVIFAPAIYTVSGGGNICPGSNAHVFLNNSQPSVGYQVVRAGVPVGAAVVGTGSSMDLGPQTIGGTYSVVANYGSPCAATMSGVATITLLPAPSVRNVTGGGGFCAGSTGVHIGLNGSDAGINYQLYNGSSTVGLPVAGTSTLLDFGVLTAAGTYTVTATNATTSCASAMNGSAIVTVNPLPVSTFSVTVSSGGAYCVGGVGVTVGLSGSESGVNYQLLRSGVPVGALVTGTGSSLAFGSQTVAGNYTVIGTNATTGCAAAMAGSATVTVNTPPAVFTVSGGGGYCAGGSGVAINLSGSASGVNYQLFSGGTLIGSQPGTGSAMSSPLITLPGIYTVQAVSAAGCTSSMLGSATVFTNPLPGTFNVIGGGAYCAGGTGVHIGLNGSSIGTNYYLSNGSSIVGGASGTSAPLDFGAELAAGSYFVSATIASTGCSSTMNGTVTILINPAPASTYAVTGGGSYCAGGVAPHVGLSGSAAGVNYTLLNGGVALSTLTGGSPLDFGSISSPGTYIVTAQDAATGCISTMSGSAVVNVNALPTSYAVAGGGNYCAGGAGVHVSIAGSNTGIRYQLLLSGTPVSIPVNGTGSAIDFGLQTTSGPYTVQAANTTTGCVNTMSGSVIVSAITPPVAFNVTGGGTGCVGSATVHVGLSNSATGVSYQLMRGSTPVSGVLSGSTGASLDFGILATTGVYTVMAADAVSGCTNTMSGSAAVGSSPLPNIFAVTGGGDYCSGGLGSHVGLSGSGMGISYQLYNGGMSVGSAVSGSGFTVDFGAQTGAGVYSVYATDLSTGCSVIMSGSAPVVIDPLPSAYAVTGGGDYCSGGSGVNVGVGSSAPGISYQLLYNGIPYGSAMTGTGLAFDFGTQTMAGIYTITATNTATGCNNTMSGTANVVIDPLPAPETLTGGGNYCPGGTGVDVGLGSGQSGISYQLYNGSLITGIAVVGSGSSASFGLQAIPGTYTVVATNPTTGCSAMMPGSVTVGTAPLPNTYNVTGGGSYCPGGTGMSVGLSGSDTWMTYQLMRGVTQIGTQVTGTGSALDFGVQGNGNYTVTATGIGAAACNVWQRYGNGERTSWRPQCRRRWRLLSGRPGQVHYAGRLRRWSYVSIIQWYNSCGCGNSRHRVTTELWSSVSAGHLQCTGQQQPGLY